METVQSVWSFASIEVLPHWPALAFILVITVIAQTLKMRVLTKEYAKKHRVVFWLRRVFPLILLGLGLIAGLTWPGEASPGVSRVAHKVWYFMACSGAAMIGFNIFKQWVKKKYDVDINVAGVSQPPPAIEE